ncbi:MAG: hypothetical protein NTY88_03950 [Bacteroidetes bacterium]|nr:hypothetical protein [Bacteroidota bacterium]
MTEWKKIFLFQFSFLLIAFLAIEFYLRVIGYQPGDLKPNWMNFQPVDSLYLISNFVTNSEGILVADAASLRLQHVVVNREGFRTKNFSDLDSTKKKILFIGDSFTWGLSAHPLDSCFADILERETNYEIINLGIPATDPPQYFELAKKYVPILKPDFVFVVFFMDNDLMRIDRNILGNEPLYFMTNAGAILADIDGKHFHTAQEAYDYCVNGKYFLRQPQNLLELIVSKSALLSRLYSYKFRLDEKLIYERTLTNSHITKKYLRGIKRIAEENKVPAEFVLIPARNEASMNLEKYKSRYADLLKDDDLENNWLTIQNSISNFTEYPDAHLNNRGHRAYADSLKLFLKTQFEKQ